MLEDLPSLLKSTLANFEISTDLQMVNDINKKIDKLQAARLSKIQAMENELNETIEEYENKVQELNSREVSNNRIRILDELNALHDLKFKLAKSYSDFEIEISKLGLMYKQKTQEFQELKELNLLNQEITNNPDSNVLKLKIYKNLGVLLEVDEGDANHSFMNEDKKYKLTINNARANVTTILNIDEKKNKLSDHFISNHIWSSL